MSARALALELGDTRCLLIRDALVQNLLPQHDAVKAPERDDADQDLGDDSHQHQKEIGVVPVHESAARVLRKDQPPEAGVKRESGDNGRLP
ncbi:hypothetical protein D3C86_1914850 [compost metagenome]